MRRDNTPAGACVLHRLHRLGPVSDSEIAAVAQSIALTRKTAARRDVCAERSPNLEPRVLVGGWAALSRTMVDGRRQILDLLLPGELLAMRPKRGLASLTTVSAITDVEFASLVEAGGPNGGPGSGLAEVYAVSNALHEHYLYRQIARLGRLNAYERTIDWFLEIHERLELSGLTTARSFPFPVTQEILADVLGMTGVHVNRTLQALRRDGVLEIREGRVTLSCIKELSALVAFEPASSVMGLPDLAAPFIAPVKTA